MRERDTGNNTVVYVEKSELLLVYCPDCHRAIYQGNDSTQTERRILKNQVYNHIDDFNDQHTIEVIHPHRDTFQVQDAEDYIACNFVLELDKIPTRRMA